MDYLRKNNYGKLLNQPHNLISIHFSFTFDLDKI